MLILPPDQPPQEPGKEPAGGEPAGAAPSPAPRQRRRGVTAMEYLVVASFILMVLIATIQLLGSHVGNLFKKDANATTTSQGP
jgi:Flp pilus assembly pilin Flp